MLGLAHDIKHLPRQTEAKADDEGDTNADALSQAA
jgi:hypothetical protein